MTQLAAVFAAAGLSEPLSSPDSPPVCPTCHQPRRIEIARLYGIAVESCACGEKPIPRIRPDQWQPEPVPNPFTPNDLLAPREPAPCGRCGEPMVGRAENAKYCGPCAAMPRKPQKAHPMTAQFLADAPHMTLAQVAAKHGYHQSTVQRALSFAGWVWPQRGKLKTFDHIPTSVLMDEYATRSIHELGERYGVCDKTMLKVLKARRIPIRAAGFQHARAA